MTNVGRPVRNVAIVAAVVGFGLLLGLEPMSTGRDIALAVVGGMGAIALAVRREAVFAVVAVAPLMFLLNATSPTVSLAAAVVGAVLARRFVAPESTCSLRDLFRVSPGIGPGVVAGLLVGAAAAISATVWFAFFGANVPHVPVPSAIPEWVPIPVVAFLPALVNSVAEEGVWRGYLLDHLRRRSGLALSIAASSASFAALHWYGYPGGPLGVFLAFLFGLVCALMTVRWGTLYPAVVTHFVADVAIISQILAR